MSKYDGEIVIGTKVDDSEFSSGLSKLGGTAAKAMAAVTAAIGAASVAIISLGSEFEAANAKASTLFGDANVNMSQYGTDMLALSTKTGLAASELGNTMYDALSAGIPASDDMSEALGFLEKNTKLAKAGFTDINTATTATAKVLNAYKMDVSETDRVHKVLMQTQNKGITTVNELGSVLSQVTPTASAMNVSFEQVGAALANMTAQGTPTAQATTQLNQLLAELGKSGTIANESLKAATEGTKYAGKSFQDLMKEGVPLNEILDLIDGTAKNNGKSMLDMFSSIESGKAALALSGQNSKQYADNLKEMGTSADVVGDAYEKVTNTFEEKSKKVVNSLKNVGIAAYDKFKEPLTKSMDAAQKSIDGLSKDMSNGKLGKSVDKIADAFGTLIEVTIDIASAAIPLLVNGFSLIVDNGEFVVASVTAISAAMLVYNNYQKITETLQKVGAGATLALGTAHAVAAGEITLADGAMKLFGATLIANPVGMVVAAIAGLTAAVAILAIQTGTETTEMQRMGEAAKQAVEEHEKLKEESRSLAEEGVKEIDYLSNLKKELDGLVDANGKVKTGYEDRAKFITDKLSDATGLEIEMIDGVITGYQDISKEIDSLMQKKRAKIILDAHESEYSDSIQKQEEALHNLNEAEKKLADTKAEKTGFIDKYIIANRNMYASDQEAAAGAQRAWEGHIKGLEDTVASCSKEYEGYTTSIRNYEQANAEFLAGNYDNINKTIAGTNEKYASSLEEQKTMLEDSVSLQMTALNNLYKNKDQMSSDQFEKDKLRIEQELLANQNKLFAMNNQIWANTPQYEEACKYLSEAGARAYDENGDMLPEVRTKIEGLRVETLNLAPEYSNALMTMANSGQTVFNENGELVTAAQKKLVDTYAKLNELAPIYSNTLRNMVNDGETVFDTNGNLTAAAQKKLVEAYTTTNNLSPKYVDILKKMAENGEMVFDGNGNLTEDAKRKIEEAAKGSNSRSPQYVNSLAKMAEDARQKVQDSDTYSAGQNFIIGAERGVAGNSYRLSRAAMLSAGEALVAMQKVWDEHSPSKASEKLAKYLMEGAGIGVEKNTDLLINPIEEVATDTIETFADILNSMDPSKIEEIVAIAENAVNNSHITFEKQAKVNAEYEVGKAILQFQNQEIKVTGTLKANIENHVNIDGRETAVALTPLIAEELAFK